MSLKEQINNTVSLEMRILIYPISIMKIYMWNIKKSIFYIFFITD